jgi:hypothetical protein
MLISYLIFIYLGNDLITLINSCKSRYNNNDVIITKTYSTIKKAVLKAVLSRNSIIKCVIPFPELLFNTSETAAIGYHLHILQVVSEMLLRFNPVDVAFKPSKLYNEYNEQIYTDMTSGKAFKAHYDRIRDSFGPNVYPLCICISGDEVQINKKGSMGCKPWYISLANIKGELQTHSSNLECIGYSPDWLYTKVKYFQFHIRM